MSREPGDKLGARLSRLTLSHTIAARKALAPIEAKISAAAAQQLIDRAGAEFATLTQPIVHSLIEGHASDMHPDMLRYLERASSGEHQWEAISGNLSMSATSALSSVLSNYLFPATSVLNAVFRNLPVDAQTGAQAVAAGLASYGAGDSNAAVWGTTSDAFGIMYKLSQSIPGGAQLFDLRNRGLISEQELINWLTRAAIPPELVAQIAALRTQLLAPADAALAVLRSNMSQAEGYAVAAANGLTNADFDILIGNTGEPLALEEMLLLWRWGKMDTATLEAGIKQSRVRDEWIPYAKELGIVPPSDAEIINAVIRGQISDAEAQSRWKIAGGDPTWYETAKTSAANPPSPTELAQMARRGLIPWTGTGPNVVSFQQGIYEGDTKDKWEPILRANTTYYPPPREIATLVKEGGMTQDEAIKLWTMAGLTPELAHEYWLAAHYTRTTKIHELAQGEIVKLYSDRAIGRDEAMSMLESVNWTKTDANWLLDISDLSLERSLLEKAISKISALYIAYKITKQTASSALAALDIPASQVTVQLKTWDLERGANIKVLTASEITDAWYYELMSPQEAQNALESIGYTAYDAWLLLNIKNKGKIEGFPQPA
jgi:hypothetical protein